MNPKVRRLNDGSIERIPLNTLSNYGISRKREKQVVRNMRRNQDPNTIPNDMMTFTYYVRDQIVTEDCVYEFPDMTILGKHFISFFKLNVLIRQIQ